MGKTVSFKTVKYYNMLNKKAKIELVKEDPFAIQYLEKIDEDIQIAAVEVNPSAIMYIDKPTEFVQQWAVSEFPDVIRYLENPSEQVQLMAVEKKPQVLFLIKNRTRKVNDLACKLDSSLKEQLNEYYEKRSVTLFRDNYPKINHKKYNPEEPTTIKIDKRWPEKCLEGKYRL